MRNKLYAAIISCTSLAAPTFADDLNINGFLSVGASMMDNDKVVIGDNDNQGGFKQDNILGLQVSKQVNESTMVTGQLVSRGSEDYKTEAAWAYVSYAATDDIDLRMGRIRVPLYFYSDFLEVGYAYDWVRTPVEVYNVPFSSMDGADVTYRFSIGKSDNSAQLYYGRYQAENSTLDIRNFTGLVLTSNIDNMTYRASYHQADIATSGLVDPTGIGTMSAGLSGSIGTSSGNPGSPSFNDILTSKGYSAAEIAGAAEDFLVDGQVLSFYEVAAAYDNGDFSFIGEYTSSFSDMAFLPDTSAFLVKAGKRFGNITSHITYASTTTSTDSGINGYIQELATLENEENSIIVGLRYDYDSSTALKFEVQQNNEDKRQGAGEIDESGMLYTVAIDLVF